MTPDAVSGSELNPEDWIALIAVVISLMSVAASLVIWRLSHSETRKQVEIQLRETVDRHNQAVREWADEVINVLSHVEHQLIATTTSTTPSAMGSDGWRLAGELSALVDRGRFLFPNENPNEYGIGKSPAYQGFRHPALDCVVSTYQLVTAACLEPPESEFVKLTNECRREFVSQVQTELAPRRQREQLAELVRRASGAT